MRIPDSQRVAVAAKDECRARLVTLTMPTLIVGLIAAGACSQPPGPVAVEGLTRGVWHADIGEDDYVYELFPQRQALGGLIHLVRDGKQMNEIPVTGVTLRGTRIEIGNRGFPPFRGEVDLEAGRMVGSIAGDARFREALFTRVEPERWPMIHPRERSDPGMSSYSWTLPEDLGDGFEPAAPGDVGIDPAAVAATIRAIVEGEAAALHSLLIVRDGKLVAEEYFYGWGEDDLHPVASCTKSVSSLLVGIAVDHGSLSGVDAPLLDFFSEYAEQAPPGWETLRVRHLLTMTTGLDWAPNEIDTPPLQGVDRFAEVIGHAVIEAGGERFLYESRGVDLLSGVLLEATGKEADRFAEEYLFAPLGISKWDWSDRSWQGHPYMGAGLQLRPRDMAKLGQLVLDEGVWEGQHVVSADWIRESTGTHVKQTPYGVQYGYLWWRVDPAPPNMPLGEVTFANGIGSQFIAIVPDAGLVLVATGGNPFSGMRQFDIVSVAEKHLLPGISPRH